MVCPLGQCQQKKRLKISGPFCNWPLMGGFITLDTVAAHPRERENAVGERGFPGEVRDATRVGATATDHLQPHTIELLIVCS